MVEQSRPLLRVEDTRAATGGDKGPLDARDQGFYAVDVPEFWHRSERSGMRHDVRAKPDKYTWLEDRVD